MLWVIVGLFVVVFLLACWMAGVKQRIIRLEVRMDDAVHFVRHQVSPYIRINSKEDQTPNGE